jgi:NADPH:quinone reductase-like Zn-dependent oxidoreductase
MKINHEPTDSIPSSPMPAPPDRHPGNPFVDLRVAITGGTSGLGLALVRELLNRGARVAFVARRRDGVEQVGHELPDAHGIVATCPGKKIYTQSQCKSQERLEDSMFSSTMHRTLGRCR